MTRVITINPSSTAGSEPCLLINFAASGTWGRTPHAVSRRIPPAISRDQAYYWSAAWQREEAESLAEREGGNAVTFDTDDPNDIIRWLLASD